MSDELRERIEALTAEFGFVEQTMSGSPVVISAGTAEELHDALERFMRGVWTKEKPSVPGWYWWKDQHGDISAEDVFVHPLSGELCIRDIHKKIEHLPGEWCGPLPVPGEAT